MKSFTSFCASMIYQDQGLEVRFKELWAAYESWWDTAGLKAFPKEKKLHLHEFNDAINDQFGKPEDGFTYRGWALARPGSEPNTPWWRR